MVTQKHGNNKTGEKNENEVCIQNNVPQGVNVALEQGVRGRMLLSFKAYYSRLKNLTEKQKSSFSFALSWS